MEAQPGVKRPALKGHGRTLSPNMTAFAEAFASNGGNKIQAYRAAYPNARRDDRCAAEEANKLLAHPGVAAYLAWLAERANGRLIAQHDASVDRIAEELCRVGFADPAEVFSQTGELLHLRNMPAGIRRAISSVKVRMEYSPAQDAPVQVAEIRFWDKVSALNTLAKWKKMLIDRSEVGRPGEFDDLTDADLERELAALEARDVILRARTTPKRKAPADGGG